MQPGRFSTSVIRTSSQWSKSQTWTLQSIRCLDIFFQLTGSDTALWKGIGLGRSKPENTIWYRLQGRRPRGSKANKREYLHPVSILTIFSAFLPLKYSTPIFEISQINGANILSHEHSNAFPHPSTFWHQQLTHSSLAPQQGTNQYLFSVLTMCSGIFVLEPYLL